MHRFLRARDGMWEATLEEPPVDNWLLDCTILSKDKTIRELVATELAKRRLALHKLAVQHLSDEE